ncbi:MAG: NAD(P)-dependent oxidoreductase [Pseudomonadota bacterium]
MKPIIILDNHFRRCDELFCNESFQKLASCYDIRGGEDHPMPRSRIEELLPLASYYVAAHPRLSATEIARSPNLKATIEVSGAFREGIDYAACFDAGIEVLSCSPGFRNAVAEMTLAMILGSARGLIDEHEAFRTGSERWLDDRDTIDFTLYGQTVGFLGFGQIAQETKRLLAPFQTEILAYDPHLTDAGANVTLTELETVVSRSRVVVVAAVPSEETRALLSAELIAKLQPNALVIVISRAWCVDFPALIAAAEAGRIKVATDVYPDEPLARDDSLRQAKNVILSPHRAAAVPGGRQLIGDMILHDIQAIEEQRPERQLKQADPDLVASLVAAQNAMQAMPNT